MKPNELPTCMRVKNIMLWRKIHHQGILACHCIYKECRNLQNNILPFINKHIHVRMMIKHAGKPQHQMQTSPRRWWWGEVQGAEYRLPISVMFYFCNTEENTATVKI